MPLQMTLEAWEEELPPGHPAATPVLAKAVCVHSDHLVRNSFPLTFLEDFFPEKWKTATLRL